MYQSKREVNEQFVWKMNEHVSWTRKLFGGNRYEGWKGNQIWENC